MNRLLLIVGGAPDRAKDITAFRKLKPVKYDVCCINEAGLSFRGPFKYWVSFHIDSLLEWAKVKPNSKAELWSSRERKGIKHSRMLWDGGGSTFVAVQLALFTWEYHRIVVAGAPLTGTNDQGRYDRFLPAWSNLIPDYQDRIRSMSGNTSLLLGKPDKEFVSKFND